MLYKGELRFNCCESTLLKVTENYPLPGFDKPVLRIASNFGGGVAGWGDICGAATGAVIAFGLVYGTEGEESLSEYESKRLKMREVTQSFLRSFEKKWGQLTCRCLLGCADCSPEARLARYNQLKEKRETHCDEYVDWVVEKTLDLLKNNI
jgi:C_GCAxxG_C_C family probable redox protein